MVNKNLLTALLLIIFIPSFTFAGTIQLPQTGQQTCWDTTGNVISCIGTGQDGDIRAGVTWPNPRFTDNGDQTVRDNLTGLIWARDGNVMNTRDPGFDNDEAVGDGAVNWQHALDYVKKLNQENYLGHNDWRLPNVNELESLVNAEQFNSAAWLKSQGFTNVQTSNYWSSSSLTYYNEYAAYDAWSVDMGWDYSVFYNYKSSSFYVWPVRSDKSGVFGSSVISLPKSGQTTCYNASGSSIACAGTGQDGELQMGAAWLGARFFFDDNQTVSDNLTGLVWTKDGNAPGPATCNPGAVKQWQGALDYIKCLNTNNYLGHNDWRLPNIKELRSLVTYGANWGNWLSSLGFNNVQSYEYLSSNSVTRFTNLAWTIDLIQGYTFTKSKSETQYLSAWAYVWPVRGGHTGSFHTLAILKTGTGTVTITSNPAGINCGSQCAAYFSKGTQVTLTAQAASGSFFTGWVGGGCSGTGNCTITLTSDTTVTANFQQEIVKLSLALSSPSTGVAPYNITFTGTSVITASEYRWDFGDGVTAMTSSGSISHTYTKTGQYNAIVTVKDYAGNVYTSAILPIIVTAPPIINTEISFKPFYPMSDSTPSTIMAGGKAIRWYRVTDAADKPVAKQAVLCRFMETGQEFTTMSDTHGFVSIETDWMTGSAHRTVEAVTNVGSLRTDVHSLPSFDVIANDRSFSREWELVMGLTGTIGIGGPSARFGPMKFQTVKAGLDAGRSAGVTIGYDIAGNATNVTLKNAIETSLTGGLSAGIFGQLWSNKTGPEINAGITLNMSTKLGNGASFLLPDFFDESSPDYKAKTLAAASFFFETAVASLYQPPRGSDLIMQWLMSKLTSLNAYQEGWSSSLGSKVSAHTGASVTVNNPLGGLPGGSIGLSILNFDTDMVLERETEEKKDGRIINNLTLTRSMNVTPFKFMLSKKFGDSTNKGAPMVPFEISASIGSEMSESVRTEKKGGLIQHLSLIKNLNVSGDLYDGLGATSISEKSFVLNIDGEYYINKIRGSPDVKVSNLINGISIKQESFQKTFEAALDLIDVPQKWAIDTSDRFIFNIPFEIGIGLGLDLGLKLDISYRDTIKYTKSTGVYSSQLGRIETERYPNDINRNHGRNLMDFFRIVKTAISDAISDKIETTANLITNEVRNTFGWLKEKIQGGLIGYTGFLSMLSTGRTTQSIRALSHERMIMDIRPQDILTAKAIGDVHIVNLKDPDGNLVTDFSANPLELSLQYTDDLLQTAGVNSGKAIKLGIYLWDGSSGFYIYRPSTVDLVNKAVTATIVKPGQYILAIDETLPIVADFQASDATPKPTISAVVKDDFSGIDPATFLFMLDGTTVVDGTNLTNYYDSMSGLFKYIVTMPLAPGNHTAGITAKDSAGNTADLAQITFNVNNIPPVISHTPITTASSGSYLTIVSSITDDTGIRRAFLFYKPEKREFAFQSVEMTKGSGSTYSAVIPSQYVTSLGIRYYLTAEDIDGNVAAMVEPIVISVTDTTPPSKPDGIKISGNNGEVTIQWAEVLDVDVAGYKIHYGILKDKLSTAIDTGTFKSATISGLSTNQTYYFAVAAYDVISTEGQKSDNIAYKSVRSDGYGKNLDVCPSGCSYASIQNAIKAAGNGDTIRAVQGTYNENLTFTNKTNLQLLGGYENNTFLVRDASIFTTIIDGRGIKNTVSVNKSVGLVIDGFTIRNGQALDGAGINISATGAGIQSDATISNSLISGGEATWGGGISIMGENGASVVVALTGNRIMNNTAQYGGGIAVNADTSGSVMIKSSGNTISNNQVSYSTSGGGIYLNPYSLGATIDFTSDGDTVSSNTAGSGSGIFAYSDLGAVLIVNILNGMIKDNKSSAAGAIHFRPNNSTVTVSLSNNLISGNTGRYGGGLLFYDINSNPTITLSKNNFSNNRSYEQGGGAWFHFQSSTSSLDIFNNIFSSNENVASDYNPGGNALYIENKGGSASSLAITLKKNRIQSNSTLGGLTRGGGLYINNTGNMTIESQNNIISNNGNTPGAAGGSSYGGGICIINSGSINLNSTNNTITGNAGGSGGGGIYVSSSSGSANLNLTNDIIWGNTGIKGADIWNYMNTASISISHSDLNIGFGGYADGGGNINADPQFSLAGNYQLTATSPCVDTGTAGGAPNMDIDGNLRPLGNGYDIGALEYIPDTTGPVTTASPAGGTYGSVQSVTLSANEQATIYYTTDGADPTESSAVYSTPIPIAANATLKFFAKDLAGNVEAIKSHIYTIDTSGPSGSIAINGGISRTKDTSLTLNLSATDPTGVAKMQFSSDGSTWSDPETYSATKAWTLSTGDGVKTIYVKFKDTVGNWSNAFTVTITLDTTAPVTTASPVTGNYGSAQSVTLSANEQATIYYTTDGADPTESSAVYSTPIPIAATTALKFFAKDLAGNVEAVKTAVYDIAHVLKGDINGNGAVDLVDAVMALQVLSHITPAQPINKNADVDGDEKIGLKEVIYILQKVVEMR